MSKLIQAVSSIGFDGKTNNSPAYSYQVWAKATVRKSKKISQEELPEMLAMHRTYIGFIERGERNPTVRTLYKTAKALKVNSSDLLPF